MDRMLDFERLDVYQRAIQFLAISTQISGRMPRGHAELRDQLRRASLSIALNIAEGTGKPSGPDRAHFHAIARGSAFECAAILDVLSVIRAINQSDADQGKRLLTEVVCMLSKMCR